MAEKPSAEEMRRRAKLGGLRTMAKYGPEFFSAIGRLGGEVIKKERGREFYAEMGRKGGKVSSGNRPK